MFYLNLTSAATGATVGVAKLAEAIDPAKYSYGSVVLWLTWTCISIVTLIMVLVTRIVGELGDKTRSILAQEEVMK